MLRQIINNFLNVEKEVERNKKMVLKYNEKYHYNEEIRKAENLLRKLKL